MIHKLIKKLYRWSHNKNLYTDYEASGKQLIEYKKLVRAFEKRIQTLDATEVDDFYLAWKHVLHVVYNRGYTVGKLDERHGTTD